MRIRVAATSALTLCASLALAAPALASGPGHDNGEGLLGETDDRLITFFSLGVVAFFLLVVCLGSYVQGRLEKRKQEQKASELRQRVGW